MSKVIESFLENERFSFVEESNRRKRKFQNPKLIESPSSND